MTDTVFMYSISFFDDSLCLGLGQSARVMRDLSFPDAGGDILPLSAVEVILPDPHDRTAYLVDVCPSSRK